MQNLTPSRLKVVFGFPVEEVTARKDTSGPASWAALPDKDAESGSGIKKKGFFGVFKKSLPSKQAENSASEIRPNALLYCQDYVVTVDGLQTGSVFESEDRGPEDHRFENLTGWLVSEIDFAKGEVKDVEIGFESLYSRSVAFVSDNSTMDRSSFAYRLSTAACWAGPIGKGRILLEPAGIDPEEVRVIKPVNRFRREGEKWVWDFEELMPTLDDDILVEAQPDVSVYMDEATDDSLSFYSKRGTRWSMVHSNYKIKASSEEIVDSTTGAAENLKSWGSWISAGAGEGEWIELTPLVPKPISAISFGFKGTYGKPESFTEYSRPKRVVLELNEERKITFDVPDLGSSFGTPDDFRFAIVDYKKPVSTLRMRFEEVWSGVSKSHLALRMVQLHVDLEKEPNLKPNR
ncbi:MAG: hypothetical protein KDN18_17985 [Verrucomicrobiae bacterium]|nr:hypothetical protein [Verrucomicrobiae bacterium]